MYGLPQVGILANRLLAKRLTKHGYYQVRHTPGLWCHTFRPIMFSLVVDDFAIQYVQGPCQPPSESPLEGLQSRLY
jgi:hypothetical protein